MTRGWLVVAFLACAGAVPAQERAPAGTVTATPDGIVLRLTRGALRVAFREPGIVRLTVSPRDTFATRPSLMVVAAAGPEPAAPHLTDEPDTIVLRTALATVRVVRATGALTVEDSAGRVLVDALAPGDGTFVPNDDPADPAWAIRQPFRLAGDEGIYGLGQYQDGVMNYRGEYVLVAQANTIAALPFLVSSLGYGILWHNYSATVFDDEHRRAGEAAPPSPSAPRPSTASGAPPAVLSSAVADEIDYYVVVGHKPADAIAGYRRLTGKAPMYGRWAYGYWQSKERYNTQQELLDVAAEYRRRGLPIDNLVQDWAYWGDEKHFSGMVWDSVRYPDPAELTRRLHEQHFHFMAVIWPALGEETDVYRAMKEFGFLYPGAHWSPSRVYDAYDSRARDLYWQYAKRGVFDVGIDAWWMDATEPEFRSTDDRYVTGMSIERNGRNALGSLARYLSPYSLMTTRGIYEHQRAATDEKRVFILTRSAFSGQQRYATTLWSGDIWSSWGVFRAQIPAGLNAGMAGLPYWTTDIGGFISNHRFPLGVGDPAYRELYVRWFQFGAFCPVFRSHGTNTPREIWRFGAPGSPEYEALVAADRLRYRLMPYIYSQAWAVHHDDATMMRALPLEFPADPRVRNMGGAFMFGPSLLVSPVTRPMYHAPARAQEWIPPRSLYSDSGSAHGLALEFFSDTAFGAHALSRKAEVLNLTWSGALPEQIVKTPYTVRYDGAIRSERAGRYEFLLTTDAGVRLTLNGRTAIDRWDNTAPLEARHSQTLAADSLYDVRLEYRQPTPGASRLLLEWITPDVRQSMRLDRRWETYLPSGQAWYDFWTGDRYAGGRTVSRVAPLGIVPLYVRAGSILPLGPALQYTGEKPADPLEIRVYEGADGAFTLYEDEGDSYRYERGVYATIPFAWNQKAGTLTVGARAGEFPGMLRTRTFRVVFVRAGHGNGLPAWRAADRVVAYTGSPIVIRRRH